MIEEKVDFLREVILRTAGAAVDVAVNRSGIRRGLDVRFAGWTKQGGPVFGLTPSGLNRHVVDVRFGSYAKPCVEHIRERASAEEYAVARGLVMQLQKNHDVEIIPHQAFDSWTVSSDLRIQVTVRGVADQHHDDAVSNTARSAMVPLIAAVAELIGCEDDDSELEGDEEGREIEMIVKRRERSARNRLLCLAAHGHSCGVCGITPTDYYGAAVGEIIEVHHIQPLSEAGESRPYDPVRDLIPLCPNCHRAIHRRIPAFTPDQLRSELQKS